MKIAMLVGVGAALLGLAGTAQAAPPKASGKYALMIFTQCEARITTTGSPVTSVNLAQSGELSVGVGSFTFPAVAASSGNASVEMVIVAGGSLRVNNSGNAMAPHTETHAGTFAFTNTTFSFDAAGATPAMTWTARFADISVGVARTIYLVRREDARCVNAITATRQAP